MITRELLEAAENVLACQIPVLQPAFLVLCIAHPLPALAMLENDNTIDVAHGSSLGIHRRDPVAEKGLGCSSHVEDFFLLASFMAARQKGDYESE